MLKLHFFSRFILTVPRLQMNCRNCIISMKWEKSLFCSHRHWSEKCQWTHEMSLFYVSHRFLYWLLAFVIRLAYGREKMQNGKTSNKCFSTSGEIECGKFSSRWRKTTFRFNLLKFAIFLCSDVSSRLKICYCWWKTMKFNFPRSTSFTSLRVFHHCHFSSFLVARVIWRADVVNELHTFRWIMRDRPPVNFWTQKRRILGEDYFN